MNEETKRDPLLEAWLLDREHQMLESVLSKLSPEMVQASFDGAVRASAGTRTAPQWERSLNEAVDRVAYGAVRAAVADVVGAYLQAHPQRIEELLAQCVSNWAKDICSSQFAVRVDARAIVEKMR